MGEALGSGAARPRGPVWLAFASCPGCATLQALRGTALPLGAERTPALRGAPVAAGLLAMPPPSPRWAARPLLQREERLRDRFHELVDTLRTAQLDVGTFYSLDALAHCFCSTAKALLIQNRHPSPPPRHAFLTTYPLFPPLNRSSASTWSFLSAWSLSAQQQLTDNSFRIFFLPRTI